MTLFDMGFKVLNTIWVLHDRSLATFEVPNIFGVKDMGILVETEFSLQTWKHCEDQL